MGVALQPLLVKQSRKTKEIVRFIQRWVVKPRLERNRCITVINKLFPFYVFYSFQCIKPFSKYGNNEFNHSLAHFATANAEVFLLTLKLFLFKKNYCTLSFINRIENCWQEIDQDVGDVKDANHSKLKMNWNLSTSFKSSESFEIGKVCKVNVKAVTPRPKAIEQRNLPAFKHHTMNNK